MSDIFIGYARKNRQQARILAEALEALGWSVFWDVAVPTGSTWEKYLDEKVAAARCVIVVWSAAAVQSEWVLEEAREGKERGILAPVRLEEVKPPFGYRGIQSADLFDWEGNVETPEFCKLARDIGSILGLSHEQVGEDLQRAAARQKRSVAAKKGSETRRRRAKKRQESAKKKTVAKKPGAKKTQARKSTAARKTTAKKPRPAVGHPAVTTGKGAPTWAADEKLNRRILIEGGEFLMGSLEGVGYKRERPQHPVRVLSFWMQQHEVTNEEYHRFKAEHEFPGGLERYPAVSVNWGEARANAEWLGGSLPTEAQWEFASRGTEGREYPWGDEEPTCELANFADCGGQLKAVGSHPRGATPEGVEDLAGNVWEWCSDWYDSYPPGDQTDPSGPSSSPRWSARVLRGGSFFITPRGLRGAIRNYSVPGYQGVYNGFRVVWSAAGGLD